MERLEIPRMELSSFTEVNYKTPLLNVLHYPLDTAYFTVENRENYPVVDYISPNRRQFYKIFHMTSGTGVLTIGLNRYVMGPKEIAFLNPDEIMSWQTTSEETGGHFCLIHPSYFTHEADHVLQLLRQYPFFRPEKAVIQLTDSQSQAINGYFADMLAEDRGDNEDKKQAIVLYLQMMLLEAQRAGKEKLTTEVPEAYGYIYGFLSLLESSFKVHDPNTAIEIKTAAEFADQLHVHPNYLNSLVKNHTGKTVRDHLQDRLIYEAKTLLARTEWDVNTISYCLGFAGHAAFSSFFKKKTDLSPSVFRKSAASGAHL